MGERSLTLRSTPLNVSFCHMFTQPGNQECQRKAAVPESRSLSHSQISTLHLQVSTLLYEQTLFLITVTTEQPIILGLPWLKKHNPVSWNDKELVHWSPFCHQHCLKKTQALLASTSVMSPILPQYHKFTEEFSKVKAAGYLPHRPYECVCWLAPRNNTSMGLSVSTLSSKTTSHGEIYPGGLPTRLYFLVHGTSLCRVFLSGEKGWGPQAMY